MSKQWNPLQDLIVLQDRMNRLFEDTTERRARVAAKAGDEIERADWNPAADIYETGGRIPDRGGLAWNRSSHAARSSGRQSADYSRDTRNRDVDHGTQRKTERQILTYFQRAFRSSTSKRSRRTTRMAFSNPVSKTERTEAQRIQIKVN